MSNPYTDQPQQQHDYHLPPQSFSVPRSPSPGQQVERQGQGQGLGPGGHAGGSGVRRPPHSHHRRSSSGSRGRYAPLDNIELAPIQEESHHASHTGNPDLLLPTPSPTPTPGLPSASASSGSTFFPSTTVSGSSGGRPSASTLGSSTLASSSSRDATSTDRLLGVHDYPDGSRQQHPATVNNNYASRYLSPASDMAREQSAWQQQQQGQRFQHAPEPYHSQYKRRPLGAGGGHGGGLLTSAGGSQQSTTARSSNTLLLSEQLRRDSDQTGTSSLWPPALRKSFFLLSGLLVALGGATMWASVARPMSGGVGTLYAGTCDGARARNAGLHVLVNTVAALSLAATSLAMQVLTAPTRAEVDRAHANRRWLEIGVMGLRNLWGVGGVDLRRVGLFCVLALSTLPVQLLFNGGVWLTEGVAAGYTVAAVAPAFEDGGVFRVQPGSRAGMLELLGAIQRNITSPGLGGYERLDVDECVARYAAEVGVPGRGHVVVVVNGLVGPDNSLVGTLDVDLRRGARPVPWVCGTGLDVARQSIGSSPGPPDAFCVTARDAVDRVPLRFGEFMADHCLAQVRRTVPEAECRVQFSLPILLVVILCIAIKLICVLLTLMRRLVVLATMGDAIASFLERPDHSTRNLSSASAQDFQQDRWADAQQRPVPRLWMYDKTWKWMAIGGRRFVVVTTFTALSAAVFTFLLVFSIRAFSATFPMSRWTTEPFGFPVPLRYPPSAIFSPGEDSLLQLAALSNLPQLLVAGLYAGLDSALTRLSLAAAFGRFFEHRRPLVVSRTPRGMQVRASRGLSLPWRYGLLLVVVVGLMGWLLSLGFGVVGVDLQSTETFSIGSSGDGGGGGGGPNVGFSGATLFLSPRPLLGLVVLVWALVVVGVVYGGCFAFPPRRMPLGGRARSAALAAACHPPEEENGEEMAEKSVQWGVVQVEHGVGRMAFSSGPVSGPVPGRLYL